MVNLLFGRVGFGEERVGGGAEGETVNEIDKEANHKELSASSSHYLNGILVLVVSEWTGRLKELCKGRNNQH